VESGFPKKSCSNKKLGHNVDSAQSHHALAFSTESLPRSGCVGQVSVRVTKAHQHKKLERNDDST
jgi:hypothetical protein